MKRRLYSLFAVLALLSATLVISAAPSGSAPLATSDRLTLGTDGSARAHPSDPAVVRARLDARDRLAGVVNRNAARAAASNGDRPATGRAQVPATDVGETNLTQRNFRNTVAQTRSSTLAEPAAAKDAAEALYMGNGNSTNGVYISRSANNGSTWTAETVPAGPSFAPNVCCDTDAVHHASLDTTFATILYLNASGTDGAIKIFVRRGSIAGGNDCTYTFDPGGTTTVP
ncbi:MAG: hypothetical protein QOI55_2714, partial [Actinomycetota bacterium]|nr:hypothetical protein [Actinomycetota bacterium]